MYSGPAVRPKKTWKIQATLYPTRKDRYTCSWPASLDFNPMRDDSCQVEGVGTFKIKSLEHQEGWFYMVLVGGSQK